MSTLKIKPEDYAVIRDAMVKIMQENPHAAENYKASGLSEKRYRWDVLHQTRIKFWGDGVGVKGDLNLYAYLNDDHIDSALRKIVADHAASLQSIASP